MPAVEKGVWEPTPGAGLQSDRFDQITAQESPCEGAGPGGRGLVPSSPTTRPTPSWLTGEPGARAREGASVVHGERERDAARLVEQG